jgi:hypothetical protein
MSRYRLSITGSGVPAEGKKIVNFHLHLPNCKFVGWISITT